MRIHLCPQTPEECRRDGLRLVISGDAAGGCVLERSSDLIHWSPAGPGDAVLAGDEINFEIKPGESAQFFRARVTP